MIIEAIIIKHLNDGLEGITVHSLVPADRPDSFVIIERTGGSIENLIKRGLFVVDCYAPSMADAAELCEDVIALMMTLPEHDEVASVRLNSHYNDTDTALHEYKYGAMFEVTYY